MQTNPNSDLSPKAAGRLMLVVGAVLFVVGGVFLWQSSDGKVNAAVQASTPVAIEAPSTTGVPVPVVDNSQVTSSQSNVSRSSAGQATGSRPTGSQSPSGGSTSGQSNAPAPVINSFQTPENIDCHNGNFQMFSASWTTTNAVKTTISIDGGGVYKTYGADEPEVSLPFNCSSAHTFKLTAYGQGGTSVTRSITLQPRNVQQPSSGDEDQ